MAQSLIYDALFPAHVNSTSVRVDHQFTPNLSLFVRFGDTPSYAQSNQLFSVTTSQLKTHTWTVGGAAQLSASHSNEFRLGYVGSSLNASTTPEQITGHEDPPPAGDINAALGVPSALNVAPVSPARMLRRARKPISTSQALVTATATPIKSRAHSGSGICETPTASRLATICFASAWMKSTLSSHFTPPPLSILADFFTLDSLLNNAASDLAITRSTPANPVLNDFALFVDDAWKLSSRLNLSAGLRWDVSPAPKGQHGQDAYTVVGDVSTRPPCNWLPEAPLYGIRAGLTSRRVLERLGK